MKSKILCSPSPGTNASVNITFKFFHYSELWSLSIIYNYRAFDRLCMNGVPGVITLESKPSGSLFSLKNIPSSFHLFLIYASLSAFSWASKAVLNLLDLCWFILALGATPSIARYKIYFGLTISIILSVYSKIKLNISTSDFGYGLPSGWQQGWIIPFISK